MDIHERIKHRRTQLGLSHQQLANRVTEQEGLKTPLSRSTVQQWEKKDGTAPKRSRLLHVAKALETTPEELMGFGPATGAYADALPDHHSVREPSPAYGTSAPWPFKVITSEQLSQLPTQQLEDLERLIVDHLMNPLSMHWRRFARDLAAEIDQKNRDEQFTNFCRAVDLKAKAARAAQLKEAASA